MHVLEERSQPSVEVMIYSFPALEYRYIIAIMHKITDRNAFILVRDVVQ